MFVYSKKITSFISQVKWLTKIILSAEIGLKVIGERFYDRQQQYSYPIKIVIFNSSHHTLGYFSPDFFEIGLHERLMCASEAQLKNIIRHELAHYLTFINHQNPIQSHGFEFRSFCNKMGWGEDVYQATVNLDADQNAFSSGEVGILRKVQKLMALASSSNSHEAEQAMIKSRQLLLKHNIDSKHMTGEEGDTFVLKRILKRKKEDAQMRAIAHILDTFFVSTVYNRAGGYIYLEILGDPINVEIADYVANFLQSELETLWDRAKKDFNLKGLVAKNSFFLGIAKGYCNKVQALKREHSRDIANALVVIEKNLADAKAMAYRRLSSNKSSRSHCEESSALGQQMGRHLTIHPAVNRQPGHAVSLICHHLKEA